MKTASDFRRIARDALYGKWPVAILTGFVASLLNATFTSGNGGSTNSSNELRQYLPSELVEFLTPVILGAATVLLIWGLVCFLIGGVCKLGYAKFNLNLVDGQQASFSDLFSRFDRFGDGFLMNLLVNLYTFLWSLLFVIPGIVKSYSYAMTPYILAEHPELSVNGAIGESDDLMRGNKWRLFCLELSFIGWDLLFLIPTLICMPLISMGTMGTVLWAGITLVCAFVVGLFVLPYREAARAAFYREISMTHTNIAA